MNSTASYDVYFYYPVKILKNNLVSLTPYLPSIHAEPFFTQCTLHPEMFNYMPFPPFPALQDLHDWVENRVRQDPALVLFAMIDKSNCAAHANSVEPGAFAGIIGLTNTSAPPGRSTEVGLLFTFPAFQGTRVTKTAIALLLKWCFEDLNMWRVQYRSRPRNIASVKVAERMGFRQEGVRRWDRLVQPGTVDAVYTRDSDMKPHCGSLHVMYLSICRDDWEEGEKERVYDVLRGLVPPKREVQSFV